jgi:hypothetical protein
MAEIVLYNTRGIFATSLHPHKNIQLISYAQNTHADFAIFTESHTTPSEVPPPFAALHPVYAHAHKKQRGIIIFPLKREIKSATLRVEKVAFCDVRYLPHGYHRQIWLSFMRLTKGINKSHFTPHCANFLPMIYLCSEISILWREWRIDPPQDSQQGTKELP